MLAAVIVTRDRPRYLEMILPLYDKIAQGPDVMLVVDNGSQQETVDLLDAWSQRPAPFRKHVVHSDNSLGGAGGFAQGMEEALRLGADWVFVADDDAVPDERLFTELRRGLGQITHDHPGRVGAVCASVIEDGRPNLDHRKRVRVGALHVREEAVPASEYEKPYFPLDVLTYVGACINGQALREVGVTDASYVIWHDDIEHSDRLRVWGPLYCVPAARMDHRLLEWGTPQVHSDKTTWKSYYGLRNTLVRLRAHYPSRYYRVARFEFAVKRTSLLARLAKHRTDDEVALFRTALDDADAGRMGVSRRYYPGAPVGRVAEMGDAQ